MDYLTHLDNPENCTSFRTKQFARLVERHYDAYLGAVDIKTTQFTLLTNVLRRGPISIAELADRMGLDASTLSRNLKPALLHHWVSQRVGEDARTRQISITPVGRGIQAVALAHWRDAQRDLKDKIGAQRISKLLNLLEACSAQIR